VNASIAVAGTQWITGYLVERLIEADHRPDLLIHLGPDRAAGISGYQDLALLARRAGIATYQPVSYGLTEAADREALGAWTIDVLIVFGWQRLIPGWLLAHCHRGAYGVHGGPEPPPRCRGRAVFNWALVLGCTRFYMYLFELTTGADEGDILEMTDFEIGPHDDIVSLYHKNCVVSSRLFVKHLPAILAGRASGVRQTGPPSVLPKRVPEHAGIAWDMPAARIVNLVRAGADVYPAAFTYLDDRAVRIRHAHVFDTHIAYSGKPGEIVDVFPNGDFVVMTGDWPVYVRRWEADAAFAMDRGQVFQRRAGIQPPDPEL
jgi:UDP-4-amino-4-deoxy-L-arabinose formyltransferase/UDP-glucuronic acid dehydrogenase (UDP-4-keto-hexauronic acid decarboxylating)